MAENNSERAFHQSRKAFVCLKSGLLVADDGFAGAHADLLRDAGLNDEAVADVIRMMPRGYALNGDVYVYQGADFSCLSDENRQKVAAYAGFFKKAGWLKDGGRVYDGMKVGKVGEKWSPVKEIEISL